MKKSKLSRAKVEFQKDEQIEAKPESSRKKYIYLFIIPALLYLLVWILPDGKSQDPWVQAVSLIDSAKKSSDPAIKGELMSRGGEMLKSLVSKHPYHARLHFYLGYYYLSNQEWDAAELSLNKAIMLDSGATINAVAPQARKFLVAAAIQKSNKFAAEKNYRAVLFELENVKHYAKHSPELCFQFGAAYQALGISDSALGYYNLALKLNPKMQNARRNAALIFNKNGTDALNIKDYQNAFNWYKKALEHNPANPDFFSNAGLALLQSGNPSEALNYLNKALELNQTHRNALANSAKAYSILGNTQMANQMITRMNSLPQPIQ